METSIEQVISPTANNNIDDDSIGKGDVVKNETTTSSSGGGKSIGIDYFKAWLLSNIVLFIICVPVLLGVGIARGWNTNLTTDKFEFRTVYNGYRFWPEPNAHVEENSEIDNSIPGRNFNTAASTWYYWKLRPSNTEFCQNIDKEEHDPVTEPYIMSCHVPQANAYTRSFVWICYLIHQCLIWGIIYKAQQEHANDVNYHKGLRWYNVYSLIINAVGYLLHLLQTHITYDGTAQDVTEASSQASVIMLLVMVLLMEYKNRGLFLGWPVVVNKNDKKRGCSWQLPTPPNELIRKYHGYAFAWATIYTLWYHPMESTVGHVLGFLHTGFLLIQQSLMFTPVHLNKYWKLVLESWVTIHGAVVASQTSSSGLWGMFAFGFTWMFVFTQIHGIPYYLGFVQVDAANSNKENEGEVEEQHQETLAIPKYVPTSKWQRYILRLIPVVIYFIVVVMCYLTVLKRDDLALGAQMTEIVRIPMILYLLALFTSFVGWGMLKCSGDYNNNSDVIHQHQGGGDEEAFAGTSASSTANAISRKSELGTGAVFATMTFCYTLMIIISVLFESYHIEMNLIVLMSVLVVIFTVLALIVMIVMDKNMKRVALGSPKIISDEQMESTDNHINNQKVPVSEEPARENYYEEG